MIHKKIKIASIGSILNFNINQMLVKKLNKIAEVTVGITKFFLDIINIAMQVKNTISLIISSESAKTPAGNIIILPSNAAKVEQATQLNQLKIFDFTLTFSEVSAPMNLDIYVAIEVAIIAKIII